MNRSVQLSKVNPGSFLIATSLGADILCVCSPTCGYYQSLHKVELLEVDPGLASGRGLTFSHLDPYLVQGPVIVRVHTYTKFRQSTGVLSRFVVVYNFSFYFAFVYMYVFVCCC